MDKWQPIETAPRDGTRIIASADEWDTLVVLSRHERLERWDDGSGDSHQDHDPTHWLPMITLPPPRTF